MTASATHANHQANRYQNAHAGQQDNRFTFEALTSPVKRAAAAFWRALMRCAVAYERTAQERIIRELALSHPQLVAEIRAARAAEAAEGARRSPVTGMWE